MYRLRRVALRPTRWCSTTSRCRSCPGAKIGVLGANGAGKSTLLRIMAGLDPDFSGDADAGARGDRGAAAPGARCSTRPRTCAATSRRARPSRSGCCAASRTSARASAGMEPDEMEAALVEYGELQEQIDRLDAWDLERKLDVAMDALRVPPGDQDVTHAVGRRAPPGRALPPAALGARPAAARRADQPPRRRVGRVAGAAPRGVRRHRRRRDPRPLLPRQRGRLDPRARPRPGHPLEGQLLVLARAEAHAPGAGGEGRVGPPEGPRPSELEWVRSSPRARQAKSKARIANYEKLVAEEGERRSRAVEIRIPAPPRLGDLVMEVRRPHQGLRRQAADGGPVVHGARPARIVGVIGANGAGKTTLFRMIAGQDEPDAGTSAAGRGGRAGLR